MNRNLVALAVGLLITLLLAIMASGPHQPSTPNAASSGMAPPVPVNDNINDLKESGIRPFPHRYPAAKPALAQDRFVGGVRYRVLDVEFQNNQGTIGGAIIEEADGSIFLTFHPRVIRFRENTYFEFPLDKAGNRSDEPRVVSSSDAGKFETGNNIFLDNRDYEAKYNPNDFDQFGP